MPGAPFCLHSYALGPAPLSAVGRCTDHEPRVKRAVQLAAIAVLGFVVLAVWWFLPGRRAEVHLPLTSSEAVPRSTLAAAPIYLKTDPKWATEKVGGSGKPLSWVGCTICCLSMALAHDGVVLDPLDLNRKLKEANGYTY